MPGNESVRDQDGYSWIQYYSLYIIYEFCLWSCPGTAVLNHQKVFCENSPILASKPGVSWDEAPIFRFGKSPPVILGISAIFQRNPEERNEPKIPRILVGSKNPSTICNQRKKKRKSGKPHLEQPVSFSPNLGDGVFSKNPAVTSRLGRNRIFGDKSKATWIKYQLSISHV